MLIGSGSYYYQLCVDVSLPKLCLGKNGTPNRAPPMPLCVCVVWEGCSNSHGTLALSPPQHSRAPPLPHPQSHVLVCLLCLGRLFQLPRHCGSLATPSKAHLTTPDHRHPITSEGFQQQLTFHTSNLPLLSIMLLLFPH